MKFKYLNIGCGINFDPSWVNIDLIKHKGILYHDINKGLPFADSTFDAVYLSHVLEHLSYKKALELIEEINRVLVPGGITMVVVPDLEQIAREYIYNLDNVLKDNIEKNKQKYDWICLELLDQMVRDKSGGLMLERIRRGYFDFDYLKQRTGDEFKDLNCLDIIKKNKVKDIVKFLFYPLYKIILIKKQTKLLSYEKHKWMYDRYSLVTLLREYGFKNINIMSYDKSSIEDWPCYNLDKSNKGDYPRKPDSLYVEAVKYV